MTPAKHISVLKGLLTRVKKRLVEAEETVAALRQARRADADTRVGLEWQLASLKATNTELTKALQKAGLVPMPKRPSLR